jgi:nucleotide sugar dehydrogenase
MREQHTTLSNTALSQTPRVTTAVVVGLGYVGLPLAVLAAKKGNRVIGLDIDTRKVETINAGASPFFDVTLTRELGRSPIEASTDFGLVAEADVVIVCVPTPVRDDHSPDLGPLEGACRGIVPYLTAGTLVVIESTINPGICETVVIPILESTGLKAGIDFDIAHCPERVNPGDANWNVENIHRVAGSLTDRGLERTLAFYRSILTGTVHPMKSLKEAEAVKIVENTFRDINIAFVNELAISFDRLGIDIVNVIQAASTKPFAFMAHYPSCGVGGHCIPVDPYYLIAEGKRNGFDHEFLSLARKINNRMPAFTVDVLEKTLAAKGESLKGARIAILGLAYKANIDDTRESPSYKIAEELRGREALPVAYDPFVTANEGTLAETLKGAQAAIIATAHDEFRNLRPEDFLEHGVSVIIDGKNCLDKERFLDAGIAYKGIGR